MVWKQLQLRNVIALLKMLFYPRFVSKFTRDAVCPHGCCAGGAINRHSGVQTKRLQRRRRKCDVKYRLDARDNKCGCCCNCDQYRATQRKPFRNDPDFLAHMAYTYRVSREDRTSEPESWDQQLTSSTLNRESVEIEVDRDYADSTDHRRIDVRSADDAGLSWFARLQRRYVPPLYGSTEGPTRSEYSSASSCFRFARTSYVGSELTDRSCDEASLESIACDTGSGPEEGAIQPTLRSNGSTSEAGIPSDQKVPDAMPTRTFNLRKSLKNRKQSFAGKRKLERKRSLPNDASRAADALGICICCSRTVPKSI